MDQIISSYRKKFPSLPDNALKNIYKTRMARIQTYLHYGMPKDICWIIEAKVRLSNEFPDAFARYMPGMGKSSFSKKRRGKRMQVCHRCARMTCKGRCRTIGDMISRNREDKLNFIRHGMSKESLDNFLLTLETHPSGDVRNQLLYLRNQFHDEQKRFQLEHLTTNDPVCQFMKKLA